MFRRGVWTPIGAGVTILTSIKSKLSITRAKIEGVKVQSVFTPGLSDAPGGPPVGPGEIEALASYLSFVR